MQKPDPEEDMDIRGGGQAAEDRRIVKEEDYGSDNDADFMEDDKASIYAHQAMGGEYQDSSRASTPGGGFAVSACVSHASFQTVNRAQRAQHVCSSACSAAIAGLVYSAANSNSVDQAQHCMFVTWLAQLKRF